MAFTCIRFLGVTFMFAIAMTLFSVTSEVDFLSWTSAANKSNTLQSLFADAAPIPGQSTSHLADLMDDIDLHRDGSEQREKDLQEIPSPSPSDTLTAGDNASEGRTETQKTPQKPSVDRRSSEPKTDTESPPAKPPVKEFVKEANDRTLPEENANNSAEQEPLPPSTPQLPSKPSQEATISKRRTRAKTFLVVFMGHSGSTAFATELRTHPDFLVELLEPLEHGEFEFDTAKALSRARELMDRGIAQGKIPGFKIRPFHVSNKPELWRQFVKEYDTRIVWQYRDNIVKQAIGEYRHKFLNDSSVIEGLMADVKPCEEGSGQVCKFKIDNFRGLHELLNEFSTGDELLTEAVRAFRRDREMHIVRYEDYLYNRERTMRDAFDFLGVEYQDTAPQRQKASPDNLCEMVTNFQELCDRFLQCQLWRPYLTDERNDCRCKPGRWQPFDRSFCQRDAWYQNIKK